jgi:hypothetical protein
MDSACGVQVVRPSSELVGEHGVRRTGPVALAMTGGGTILATEGSIVGPRQPAPA